MFHCTSRPAYYYLIGNYVERTKIKIPSNVITNLIELRISANKDVSCFVFYTIVLHTICCACIADQLSVFSSNL